MKGMKAIASIMWLLASILTLTFSATMVSAGENEAIVMAWHDRLRIYEASIFEDSVSNAKLNGLHKRSYYIRLENVEVHDAKIVMVTPYHPPEEYFPSILWDPEADFTVVRHGRYRYEWAFSSAISEQAAVWLDTNFPVTFKPGFSLQRNWDPGPITPEAPVIQTLTIEFTPFIDFHNAHILVGVGETDEAIPTIVSSTASPLWYWFETPDGREVNWQGDPEVEMTYTFSVDINVENKLSEPIFYKPSAGVGANFFIDGISVSPSTETVTVKDQLIKGSVTYSGTGPTGELYDWQVVIQHENVVSLPSYSSTSAVPPPYEYLDETIQDLPDESFNIPEEDVPDAKHDFSDLLADAFENIDDFNYEGAIEKLNRIKEKINEEIVESDEREEIISMIDNLIAYLETL